MDVFFYGYLFVIGLVIGSFLNVVGLRLPVGESIVKPPSHCPSCGKRLRWSELIPVLSYVFQKGKCKKCGVKISPLYPSIELATAILFTISSIVIGWSKELPVTLLFITLLITVFITDIKYMLIPNRILLFFGATLLPLRLFVSPLEPWWSSLLGAGIGFLLLYAIAFLSKGGMGGGDVKLFFVLGIVLGWKGVLLTLFLASLFGTIVGVILMSLKRVKRRQAVPFGPYIVVAATVVYFFGNSMIAWYLQLL